MGRSSIDEEADYWISRWDTMQEYYNPDREERFSTLFSILQSKCGKPEYVLDIGCGAGSLMERCAESFPSVHVMGVDLDFTLLRLAKARLVERSEVFSIISMSQKCWTIIWQKK